MPQKLSHVEPLLCFNEWCSDSECEKRGVSSLSTNFKWFSTGLQWYYLISSHAKRLGCSISSINWIFWLGSNVGSFSIGSILYRLAYSRKSHNLPVCITFEYDKSTNIFSDCHFIHRCVHLLHIRCVILYSHFS